MHAGGRQHLFFQSHPHAPEWGPPQWDHVSSADLVHWERHPTALRPSADGPDRDGCWSGCVVVVDGRPTAFYTGVTGSTDADRREAVCRAVALDDDLVGWEVDPEPLLPVVPGFSRDPFVWQDDEGWHLLLGAAGSVQHARSPDGVRWEATGAFYEDAAVGGRHWECPQLLRLPEGDVLLLSVQDGTHEQPLLRVVAVIGRAAGGRFTGGAPTPLEAGDCLYAPSVCREPGGRWLLWAWLRETLPAEHLVDLGRVGALSLPFACTLEGGRLVLRPVHELRALRGPGRRPGPVDGPVEVRAVLDDAAAVVLRLGPQEQVAVRRTGRELAVDRSAASSAGWGGTTPLVLEVPDGPREVRLLRDGSVLVVLVDGELVAVTRVYPLAAEGGAALVEGDAAPVGVWGLAAR